MLYGRSGGCVLLGLFFVSLGAEAEDWLIDQNTPPTSGWLYYPQLPSNNNVTVDGLNNQSAVVYGGRGSNSSGNNLVVSGSRLAGVYASYYQGSGGLNGNYMEVSNSTVGAIRVAWAEAGGVVSNNVGVFNNVVTGQALIVGSIDGRDGTSIVVLNSGRFIGGSYGPITAGWGPGFVNGNSVYLENTTNWGRVQGGIGSEVSGNTAVLVNAIVGDSVFGGELKYNYNASMRSVNNTVELRGTTKITNHIYGGALTSNTGSAIILDTYDYDIVSGNTLKIAPTLGPITAGGDLANFSYIEFDFSDYPAGDTGVPGVAGDPALTVRNANLLPGGYISNIGVSGLNHAQGRVLLIKSDNEIYFGGQLNNATDIPGLGGYDFLSMTPLLLDSNKQLVVDYGLNWYFDNTDAHGNFTLTGDEDYLLSVVLSDRNPVPVNTAGWNGKDLTKKGTGTLILDEDNSYTGTTTIEAGTLQLGDGEAVGSIAAASAVTIDSGGVLAMNRSDNFTLANSITGAGAVTQMGTGQLLLTANNTYSGGTNVYAGSLAIANLAALGSGAVRNNTQVIFDAASGSFNNTIVGSGDVSFSNGSDVRLLAGLTASDITIDAGSSATIASTNAFAGNITDNGVLAVDLASDYVFDGPISGTGVLNQEGTGQLLLTKANSYTGGTNINAGTLAINNVAGVGTGAVNNAGTFVFAGANGSFANAISGTGNVRFANGSNIDITGPLAATMTTVDAGSRASVAAGQQWDSEVSNAGTLDLAQNSTINGAVNNSGQLSLAGNAVQASIIGNVLNAGQINLDGDDSVGSLLTINGDYQGSNGALVINTALGGDNSPTDLLKITGAASGQTEVQVRNIGGLGDEALRGIRIIETGSSTTDAFALRGGHVAAGAYDYALLSRTETGGVNWYLHNGDEGTGPTYTPGLGSVIANTMAANSLFSMRFEDREGAGQSQIGETLGDNLWVRYAGGNNKFRALNGQLHTKGHSSTMQVGVGLPSLMPDDSMDWGVMGGYGRYKGNTHSSRTERKSSSVVEGYSLGLYNTWYSNPGAQSGVYIDSWLLWNHFNNRIKGADEHTYKYKAKGVTASIEVGKGFAVGEVSGADIWMQPQAQVTYQGVRADTFEDAQEVTAKRGSDNVQLRAGVKTYADALMLGNMSSRPFVEVNYIHNTDPYSVKIDDKSYRAMGGKNIGEVRLGLEGYVAGSHQMWLNTGYADGGKHYRDFSVNLGWKHLF